MDLGPRIARPAESQAALGRPGVSSARVEHRGAVHAAFTSPLDDASGSISTA
jgi:hypothetical protein